MSIISVSITASDEQIVSGIPRSITIATNMVSTIFYTLDNTTPTIFSTIYTGPIQLPTDQTPLVLQVFATDGVSSSPVIVNTYQTTTLGPDTRVPHSGTDARPNAPPTNDPYPFGTPPIEPQGHYLGIGAAGLNVDDPSLPQTPTGFNAEGQPDGYTNEPLIGVPTKTQPIIFSETDAEGQEGPGIGTLPRSTIIPPVPPPEQANVGGVLFDPRAMVIYQDSTKPNDPNAPVFINKMHFTLEDVNHARDGNQYFNTALDAPPVSGGFLRSHFNSTDNTLTYYYFDSTQNRWIINKTSFIPTKENTISNYWGHAMFGNRTQGSNFVFKWVPFKGSWLY